MFRSVRYQEGYPSQQLDENRTRSFFTVTNVLCDATIEFRTSVGAESSFAGILHMDPNGSNLSRCQFAAFPHIQPPLPPKI